MGKQDDQHDMPEMPWGSHFHELEVNHAELVRVVTTIDSVLRYAIPTLATFGVLGNILNIVILSRQSMVSKVQTSERSPRKFLLALAVSDLMFCALVIPATFLPPLYEADFLLFFRLYGFMIINIFLTASTFLSAVVALERLIVISQPFRALVLLSAKRAKILIGVVFLLAVVLNAPIVLRYGTAVVGNNSDAKLKVVFRDDHQSLRTIYRTARGVIINIVPAILILVSTTLTICSLRKNLLRYNSLNMVMGTRTRQCSIKHAKKKSLMMTRVLLAVNIEFLIFVAPADAVKQLILLVYTYNTEAFLITVKIFNVSQLFAFSTNCILYWILSATFRQTAYGFCTTPGFTRRSQASDLAAAGQLGRGSEDALCCSNRFNTERGISQKDSERMQMTDRTSYRGSGENVILRHLSEPVLLGRRRSPLMLRALDQIPEHSHFPCQNPERLIC